VISTLVLSEQSIMFGKIKKNRLPFKPALYTMRWYPSNISCVNSKNTPKRPKQIPPLMVRKPEWRR